MPSSYCSWWYVLNFRLLPSIPLCMTWNMAMQGSFAKVLSNYLFTSRYIMHLAGSQNFVVLSAIASKLMRARRKIPKSGSDVLVTLGYACCSSIHSCFSQLDSACKSYSLLVSTVCLPCAPWWGQGFCLVLVVATAPHARQAVGSLDCPALLTIPALLACLRFD